MAQRTLAEARAEARTIEELTKVGEEFGMSSPYGWAMAVYNSRQKSIEGTADAGGLEWKVGGKYHIETKCGRYIINFADCGSTRVYHAVRMKRAKEAASTIIGREEVSDRKYGTAVAALKRVCHEHLVLTLGEHQGKVLHKGNTQGEQDESLRSDVDQGGSKEHRDDDDQGNTASQAGLGF